MKNFFLLAVMKLHAPTRLKIRSRLWNIILSHSQYASDPDDYDDADLLRMAAEVAYLEA